MITYQEQKNGSLSIGYQGIQKAGTTYQDILKKVEAGEAEILPYVEPEKTQEQINAEHRAYLDSTDWYAARKSETGEKIPNQILKARQDARDGIIE